MSRYSSRRRWQRIEKPHIFFDHKTQQWDVHMPHDLSHKYSMTFQALDFAERLNKDDSWLKSQMLASIRK